jgi:hypothetical protein
MNETLFRIGQFLGERLNRTRDAERRASEALRRRASAICANCSSAALMTETVACRAHLHPTYLGGAPYEDRANRRGRMISDLELKTATGARRGGIYISDDA